MKGVFRIPVLIGLLSIASFSATYSPPSGAVSAIGKYRGYSDLTTAAGSMDLDLYTHNITTWQMDHGGFFKAYASKYVKAWNGEAKSDQFVNNVYLGTIDNNATVQEMRLMAVRYKATTNSTYKAEFKTSFQKALQFLLAAQRSKGGWPQMWPKREMYSDQVTFNDNAMIRTMVLLKDVVDKISPFDSDIIGSTDLTKVQASLNKGVDFILKSQIYNNNIPTVWCAQHDTNTYVSVGARAYELASKSGSESAGIVWFLMNWPNQTDSVRNAVKGAINWYKKNRIADMKFSSGNFVASTGASMWYRFYEVNTDDYFFCDRAGISTKTQDITKISDERRTGYQWAGDYGSGLISVESSYLTAIAGLGTSSAITTSSSSATASSSSSAVIVSAVIEGENFITADGVKESTNTGFSGTGYLNMNNAIGASATYELYNCTEAPKTIFFRYAGNTTRGTSLSNNTATFTPVNLTFTSTGSWTVWQTETATITLPVGKNTLKLTSLTADGAPNLDWIGWNDANIRTTACPENPSQLLEQKQMQGIAIAKITSSSLVLSRTLNGNFDVKIFNLFGKQIQAAQGFGLSATLDHPLPAGMYIVEIQQSGRLVSRSRVTIQRN